MIVPNNWRFTSSVDNHTHTQNQETNARMTTPGNSSLKNYNWKKYIPSYLKYG